jgi:hypothetical protein
VSGSPPYLPAVDTAGDPMPTHARRPSRCARMRYHRGAPPGAPSPRERDYPTGRTWRRPADGPRPESADTGR